MDNTVELLKKLTSTVGVSGEEENIVTLLKDILKKYGNVSVDSMNNVYCTFGQGYHFLLDAHLDEIGMIVTDITDDGFIKVNRCGGIDRRMLLGYEVSVWGKEEVKGIISFGKNIRVFKNLEEIINAEIERDKKYCLLTQTTLNKKILEKIKSFLENNYSNVKISDKVCGATQVRQQAVEELSKDVDILLVIGGKNSSNTKKLYDISKAINESTYLIQDESEIKKEWFRGCKKIGITAGASTPEEIVINIENKIRGIFNV